MAGADAAPGSEGPGNDEVAALVWKLGQHVDPPVTVVVDGREYVAGAGPPEGRVEMTEQELRRSVAEADSAESD
ncbi:MAG: hypothetical protein QOK43_2091 [Acidimicrobiaceae bacterium]|nr:hypothetical protein [Acidimicrobiaceae bacterium]